MCLFWNLVIIQSKFYLSFNSFEPSGYWPFGLMPWNVDGFIYYSLIFSYFIFSPESSLISSKSTPIDILNNELENLKSNHTCESWKIRPIPAACLYMYTVYSTLYLYIGSKPTVLDRIGGVMVSVFASWVLAPVSSNQRLLNWYLLLLR